MIGVVLFVVGVVAGIVAVVAARNPHGRQVNGSVSVSVTTVTAKPGSTRFSTPSSSSTSSAVEFVEVTPEQAADRHLHPQQHDPTGPRDEHRGEVQGQGLAVVGTENYSNDIISSCAYYDPSDPQNLTVAQQLQAQFPGIQRVAPRFPELPDYPIVVILNPDYAG